MAGVRFLDGIDGERAQRVDALLVVNSLGHGTPNVGSERGFGVRRGTFAIPKAAADAQASFHTLPG